MSDDIIDTVESERFQEILTLKKRVLDTRDEIDRATATGQLAQGPAIGLYQRKVRDYVMSVETVLNPANGEPSKYWTEEPIGDYTIPGGEHNFVVGLQEFLELPTTHEVEVEREQKRSYRHAVKTVTETQRVRPPQRLIERAFRITNRALDDAGFDLDEPSEKRKSKFNRVDDVEKATKILDFLRSLDNDGLREVQLLIEQDLLSDDELRNGHHE